MARSKKNTGSWLVTYSDLVTLLMVFFVLLYVLTPGIDQSVFQNFISYFQSSVGVMEQSSIISKANKDQDNYRQELSNQWIVVEDFLEAHDLESQVEIEMIPEGVKITLSDSLTFNSGSSRILPGAIIILERISEMINEEVESIEVQGHTDNVPIAQASFYRSNWHLGAARSVSVIEYLIGQSDLPPESYQATSFGEYRPIATNETAFGRRQNRRVEIYFLYTKLMQNTDFSESLENVPINEFLDFREFLNEQR